MLELIDTGDRMLGGPRDIDDGVVIVVDLGLLVADARRRRNAAVVALLRAACRRVREFWREVGILAPVRRRIRHG